MGLFVFLLEVQGETAEMIWRNWPEICAGCGRIVLGLYSEEVTHFRFSHINDSEFLLP